MTPIYFLLTFLAKVADNALGTAKTILVQRNRAILASICVSISNFIYFKLTKNVVLSNNDIDLYIVAVAGGIGCFLAMKVSNKFSKERTYVNVIMSDDIEQMKELRDFLAVNKITNVVSDSYTLDWDCKTLTITAYANTKDESKLINKWLENSEGKFKRVVQKG